MLQNGCQRSDDGVTTHAATAGARSAAGERAELYLEQRPKVFGSNRIGPGRAQE